MTLVKTEKADVAIVDTDEGAEGPRLDLALVLEDLVGLDDDHGEIADGEPSDVANPDEAILAFSSSIGVVSEPERLPTARDKTHQCLEHPTSLRNPNQSRLSLSTSKRVSTTSSTTPSIATTHRKTLEKT
ncbi:hypothetical protein VNO80_03531 [Phaseolus coccineus]|uniref:Uncharacterized protein n=1 Tax=Phaseolus coccineus TaxID=3886 RepID=A0AAN9RIY1_PHACN